MTCEKYHTGSEGGTIIICAKGKRQPRCACSYTATRLCDWKIAPHPSDEGAWQTCDKPLCPKCTYEPVEGKDLCKKHAEEWLARSPTQKPRP